MSSPLKLSKPNALNDGKVSAWFTLKNAEFLNTRNEIPGLNLGFNTQVSSQEIEQNRGLLSNEIATPLSQIAYANQIHGTEIREVTKGGFAGECDGLITTTVGVALAIQVADCAAVLLCDKEQGVIAAVHAGWRGAVGGIIPKVLEIMTRKGTKVEQIQVYISPCISKEMFEVGEEVAEQFPNAFVDTKSFDKPRIDLKGFITHQLVELGVLDEQIECEAGCTVLDSTTYYSYRREREKSGRMMAIIKLNY